MQIITTQMLVDIYHQSHEMVQTFFNLLLATTWQNVMNYFKASWYALIQHDWNILLVSFLILISGVILLYRLVRNNFFMALKSIVDR